MPIDTLKALVRNGLKKTGDAMIDGFLTLFQDPTQDMHAVTKRYVDTAVAGVTGDPVPIIYPLRTAGWYQAATHRDFNATTGLIGGVCRMVPMWLGDRTTTFDGIGFYSGLTNAGQAFRVGFYSLDSQLMPTALLRSLTLWTFGATAAGTFVSTTLAALGEANVVIPSQSTGYVGVAVRCEGFVGTAGGLIVATTLLHAGMPTPYGHVVVGGPALFHALAVQSTDVTPGAMPAAATFTTANFTTADWGLFLRDL